MAKKRTPDSDDTEHDRMWQLLLEGSDELAEDLDVVDEFTPRSLGPLDGWIAAQEGRLDEEDTARLAFFLARVLVETHGGGLVRIVAKGHPLDGEWAVSGFARGLAADYHVPVLLSAARIAVERELTALAWYGQLLQEGRP